MKSGPRLCSRCLASYGLGSASYFGNFGVCYGWSPARTLLSCTSVPSVSSLASSWSYSYSYQMGTNPAYLKRLAFIHLLAFLEPLSGAGLH